MTNIEKLTELAIIGDIRQRLGASDENDTSKDYKINEMSNYELIKKWCGWNIGDEEWWVTMKYNYDMLEKMKN